MSIKTSPHYHGTYDGLKEVVEKLRGPEGCPWDKEQSQISLKEMLLSECYELVEAIESDRCEDMIEELGDVMFNIVIQMGIADEQYLFTDKKVFKGIVNKLVRRHPHVFQNKGVTSAREVEANWNNLKKNEKHVEGTIIDSVPKTTPALMYAQEVQKRAASEGLDWEDYDGVVSKVAEEIYELGTASSQEERESELGDLLFSIVNVARWLGIDAESSLRHANKRFSTRFQTVTQLTEQRSKNLSELSPHEKDDLWQEAKSLTN